MYHITLAYVVTDVLLHVNTVKPQVLPNLVIWTNLKFGATLSCLFYVIHFIFWLC